MMVGLAMILRPSVGNDDNDGEIYFIVEDSVLRDRMVRGPAG